MRLEGRSTEFKSYLGATITLILYSFVLIFLALKLERMFTHHEPEIKVRVDEDALPDNFVFTDSNNQLPIAFGIGNWKQPLTDYSEYG